MTNFEPNAEHNETKEQQRERHGDGAEEEEDDDDDLDGEVLLKRPKSPEMEELNTVSAICACFCACWKAWRGAKQQHRLLPVFMCVGFNRRFGSLYTFMKMRAW